MKVVNIKDCDINVPKGSAFSYNTPDNLPKGHMVCIAVGKRGSGKSVAVTNLCEMLKFDRILVISPTFSSNSLIMKNLNIDPTDVFEDPDDLSVVDKIIAIVEQERDDLVIYLEQMKKYNELMKKLKRKDEMISDDLLEEFYDTESHDFMKPQHKYNGRNPFISLIIDDCQSSKLFTNKRIQNLCIKHRHVAAFDDDRASIGLSLFFLVQNYKSKSGGIDRAIRNNATCALLFKNKDQAEIDFIAGEMGGEVDKDTFLKVYDYAMEDGDHPFLFIDLHKKDNHPSMFRSRFNKFLIDE